MKEIKHVVGIDKEQVSYSREEEYLLREFKRNIEKEKRREATVKDEIKTATGGKQIVLINYR